MKPEDFIVEEIPLYDFSGEGEHTILKIEKCNVSTFDAIRRICRQIKFKDKNVGLAGLKDSQAITQQYLSFQLVPEESFRDIDIRDVKILNIYRHNNKLRRGQLRGNKFTCIIREVDENAEEIAQKIAEEIKKSGLPNYYDSQRFGMLDNNHVLGLCLIKRDYKGFVSEFMKSLAEPAPDAYEAILQEFYHEAWEKTPDNRRDELKILHTIVQFDDFERAVKTLPKRTLKLLVSSFQSYLFNDLLDVRIDNGKFNTFDKGDVAYLHRNGAAFVIEDVDAEILRCKNFEISPSGPIFGTKSLLAEDAPGEIEREILEKNGLELEDFKLGDGLGQKGARRPFRIKVENLQVNADSEKNLHVEFELPSGSYATILLKEFTKSNL